MDFVQEQNRIYIDGPDGKPLAEVDFPCCGEGVVEITHTFVDSSLRGQGVAGKLLALLAVRLRREGKKALPTCSYAVGWFEAHKEEADLLA